jgi:hypothetical protein
VLRERVVVLAEGAAFGSEPEAPRPEAIRIVASGGSSAPVGQASVVLTSEQGDRQ